MDSSGSLDDRDHEQGKDQNRSKNSNRSSGGNNVGEHHGVVGVDSGILGFDGQQSRVSGNHVLRFLLSKNVAPDGKGRSKVVLVKTQGKWKDSDHFDRPFVTVDSSNSVKCGSDICLCLVRDSFSFLFRVFYNLSAVNVGLWDTNSGDRIKDGILFGCSVVGILGSVNVNGLLGKRRFDARLLGRRLEESIGG